MKNFSLVAAGQDQQKLEYNEEISGRDEHLSKKCEQNCARRRNGVAIPVNLKIYDILLFNVG